MDVCLSVITDEPLMIWGDLGQSCKEKQFTAGKNIIDEYIVNEKNIKTKFSDRGPPEIVKGPLRHFSSIISQIYSFRLSDVTQDGHQT